MLTRIELDGFKTFRSFVLDVSPFMVLLGRNASGKSNLFDAVQLIRRLSEMPVIDALQGLRGTSEELFHVDQAGAAWDEMSLAVEVLLEPTVRDRYGDQVQLTHTRVRYEVTVSRRDSDRGTPRFYVEREDARIIRKDEDRWPAEVVLPAGFRATRLKYSSRRSADLLLTSVDGEGRKTFEIRQDGHAGRPRVLPAQAAEASVLQSITTAEFPLLYALRQEMQSWRFLQLDPDSLRRPSAYRDEERALSPKGDYLAAVLHRIRARSATSDRPDGDLPALSADLSALVPGVRGVVVVDDPELRQWRVNIVNRDEAPFSARVASDGTLRLLALLAVFYDPDHRGLVCFEEPENGIYPQRLVAFARMLRELTSPDGDATSATPVSQLLMNSHSPLVLEALDRRDIVFLDTASLVTPGRGVSRVTRARRLRPEVDGRQLPLPFDDVRPMSESEISAFHARAELDVAV